MYDVVWNDLPYVVIDTETSGLGRRDRICEITVMRCYRGEPQEEFTSLVNPGVHIHPDTTAIHGITDEDVATAPYFHEIEDKVLELMYGESPWVAHNLSFDLRMLAREISPDRWPVGLPTLCTLDYSKRRHQVWSMRRRHKLVDLADYLDIPIPSNTHRSRVDCLLLAAIVPPLVGDEVVMDTLTKFSTDWPTPKWVVE